MHFATFFNFDGEYIFRYSGSIDKSDLSIQFKFDQDFMKLLLKLQLRSTGALRPKVRKTFIEKICIFT